ncbi:hypothetical protein MBLNU457_5891t1 [Dothideomycetes sp. NU457]
MAESNPLIEALPPASDYLTYLTIVEYNLTVENLPTLHEVLQDTKLTTNIGWDLIHLLLPLLPASQQCLQDIARLGNPRECILKVTESLRLIDYEGFETDDYQQDDDTLEGAQAGQTHPARTAAVDAPVVTQAAEMPPDPPLQVSQFTSLLSMLSILHPRIKTKYPSRFLSTTLQAVLASLSRSVTHHEELVSAIIRFVKDIGGPKRPHLPPRKSSSALSSLVSSKASAPDPEPDQGSDAVPASESEIQIKLLQSFITHVIEEYMLDLSSMSDVPGVAWCVRLQERLHPERIIPGKTSMTDRFQSDEALHERLSTLGALLALARDINISSEDLLAAASYDDRRMPLGSTNDEDEPPQSAKDIPLSKVGSLLFFTARAIVRALYTKKEAESDIAIFPEHYKLLMEFVSDPAGGGLTVGQEPEPILDALLTLGLLAIEDNRVGEPTDTEQFNRYLQIMSLISSNAPSPSLRYHAFYITSTILRSNPSDIERLAFIRDTLEHCPFDNLKVAAVSWIKGEIIEANPPTPVPGGQSSSRHQRTESTTSTNTSVFATPVALDTLAPFLFPDLTHDLASSSMMESWAMFEENLHFYLASLNFYFLLLSAKHLHKILEIPDLHSNNDIAGSFMHPLRLASQRYREEQKTGNELTRRWQQDQAEEKHLAELELLDATLEKVTQAVADLNKV